MIFLGKLAKSGYSYSGHGDVLKIARGSLVCMKAILKNGIFVMIASTLCGDVAVGEDKTYKHTKLWHFSMAYMSI